MKVPADRLASLLGITQVRYVQGATVSGNCRFKLAADTTAVSIDNFSFSLGLLTVPKGARVTWTNQDDIPHNVVNADQAFASPVLDTADKFTHQFTEPGEYRYYCSLHPRMTGKLIVSEG